jgi:hypothetical protein
VSANIAMPTNEFSFISKNTEEKAKKNFVKKGLSLFWL